jgi:hypothetical protein
MGLKEFLGLYTRSDIAMAKASASPNAYEQMSRAQPQTPEASGTVLANGYASPMQDSKTLVKLVLTDWMVGTAVDKIVMEVTREGWDWELDDPTKEPQREQLEAAELSAINTLIDKPTIDQHGQPQFTFKDVLRSIAFYHVAVGDSALEIQPDPLGRPTALNPLPTEYLKERERGKPPQKFCPRCYKADTWYDETQVRCPDCGSELYVTAWAQVDDDDKVIARWAANEIIFNCARSYGSRRRGVSKVQRVWYIAQVLRWMERNQYAAYAMNISPDKTVTFPGMDQEEVNVMFQSVAEWKRKNPSIKRTLALGVKDPPIVVDLMDSLVDLDARNLAEFYREAIAINFGVSLQALGIQTPGKLGKETETIEVSMDTVEEAQAEIEELVNVRLVPLFPEIKSFKFELRSPKKDDLLRKAQIEQMKVQTIVTLKGAGAELDVDDDLDFTIREWTEHAPPSNYQYSFGQQDTSWMDSAGQPAAASWASPPLEKSSQSARGAVPFGASLAKSLSPRHAPPGEGVPSGLASAEKDFLELLLSIRDGALHKLERAKSPDEMRAAVAETLAELEREITKEAREFQVAYYAQVLENEAGKEGWDPAFTQTDLNALEYMQQDPTGLESALTRFVGDQRKAIFAALEEAYATPGGLSLPKIRDALGEVIEGTKYELERIARTETTRITNHARQVRWSKIADPMDEYELVPASDAKVCPLCNAVAYGGEGELDGVVHSFHGNPYTMAEMQSIDRGKGSLHPHDRCTWVRRPVSARRR